MDALVVVGVGVLLAVVVVVVLVRRHVPAEGFVSWLRESFASTHGHRRDGADHGEFLERAAAGAERSLSVADIIDLAEDGPAYHTPVDLREVMERARPHR